MSNPILIAPFLLASSGLLRLLTSHAQRLRLALTPAQIEEQVFLTQHGVNYGLPDHVFQHRWLAFKQDHQKDSGLYAAPALFSLASQFLQMKNERAAVHLQQFGDWQNLLARMSGLPVQAALFARQDWAQPDQNTAAPWLLKTRISEILGETPLACPYDACVENYLLREGLHESHMHLNGTTQAEMCWQRALLDPAAESQEFALKYSKDNKVRELCHTIDPDLTPLLLRQRLHLARQLRSALLGFALGQTERPDSTTLGDIADSSFHFGPTPNYFNAANLPHSHQIEAWWLCLALVRIEREQHSVADRYLHLYLLLQNQHWQLMVQRDDLFGFDQFQKFTFTDLRSPAERDYTARFWQMHGRRHSPSLVASFEGRFAPKDSCEKNLALISDILRGYWAYLNDVHTEQLGTGSSSSLHELLNRLDKFNFAATPRKMELALVVHFIKSPWKHKKDDLSFRHAALRAELRLKLSALCQIFTLEPRLLRWVCGIDGASNELHAPPEVFAPIFRVARFAGMRHATYHVGEDFVHLIGGIRQVSDTLTLLQLQPGDRIGHGTALGLTPRLWLQTMPHTIALKRGEWMIDMVCAWDYLRKNPTQQTAAWKAASEAVRLAGEIFQVTCSVEQLHAMLALRGLWPQLVLEALADDAWDWRFQSSHDGWREEAKLVAQAMQRARSSVELLARWWQESKVLACCEEFIDVAARFFDETQLLALQQAVQQQVVTQDVIIETLPTSNVRISQYQHVRQHHSLRWMGIHGHKLEGDAPLLVSLGSDDPGIFATDMRSEFYHLYSVLRFDENMRDVDALAAVAQVNERGNIYRFHGHR
jgi:hypothetical protein